MFKELKKYISGLYTLTGIIPTHLPMYPDKDTTQIVKKPWGMEDILEANDKYVMKDLYIYEDYSLSLQYHEFKHETIMVHTGHLLLELRNEDNQVEFIDLYPGDYFVIPPKLVHRMIALEFTVVHECSTPELDDVIRLEDDYGRV